MSTRTIRLGLLATPLLILTVLFAAGEAPSARDVERIVTAAGPIAPIAFIALYVSWTVLVLPGSVATIAAGALFGLLLGGLVTVIGAVIGATAAFGVARRAGRRDPGERPGPRTARLEQWLQRDGFTAMLSARLLPGVPFNALNYAAGVARVSPRSYVLATALGILPGTLTYAAIGSSLTHHGSLWLLVPLYALRAAVVIGIALVRVRPFNRAGISARKRHRAESPVGPQGAAGARP